MNEDDDVVITGSSRQRNEQDVIEWSIDNPVWNFYAPRNMLNKPQLVGKPTDEEKLIIQYMAERDLAARTFSASTPTTRRNPPRISWDDESFKTPGWHPLPQSPNMTIQSRTRRLSQTTRRRKLKKCLEDITSQTFRWEDFLRLYHKLVTINQIPQHSKDMHKMTVAEFSDWFLEHWDAIKPAIQQLYPGKAILDYSFTSNA